MNDFERDLNVVKIINNEKKLVAEDCIKILSDEEEAVLTIKEKYILKGV